MQLIFLLKTAVAYLWSRISGRKTTQMLVAHLFPPSFMLLLYKQHRWACPSLFSQNIQGLFFNFFLYFPQVLSFLPFIKSLLTGQRVLPFLTFTENLNACQLQESHVGSTPDPNGRSTESLSPKRCFGREDRRQTLEQRLNNIKPNRVGYISKRPIKMRCTSDNQHLTKNIPKQFQIIKAQQSIGMP